jgi:Asp-tRNA(Asn)/Glu-tRNA(Gln) amidotransferase A subunit family amidase
MWEKADADAREAIEGLAREVGAREIDLPDLYRDAWSGQRAIMAVDMAHNLGAFVDKGGEVSTTFRALIEEGRKVTATQYLAALRDAERYAEGMIGIFEQFADAVITLSAKGCRSAGHRGDRRSGILLAPTLVGFPSLNLPLLANTDGLPIGVQLVGAPGRDERLLRTARTLVKQLAEAE